MSVTFAPAFADSDVLGWGFACYGNAHHVRVPHVLGAKIDAVVALESHARTCEECAAYGHVSLMVREDIPSANLANGNAVRILSLLGFDAADDLCGGIDAAAMLDRIAFATVVGGNDPGTEDIRDGNVIFCGRHEGYTDDVLERLTEVATWAAANGREVHWG